MTIWRTEFSTGIGFELGPNDVAIRGIARMHQQGAALRSLHQAFAVMHPGVVTAQMTPADEQQIVFAMVGVVLQQLQLNALDVVYQNFGRQSDAFVRRCQTFGQATG